MGMINGMSGEQYHAQQQICPEITKKTKSLSKRIEPLEDGKFSLDFRMNIPPFYSYGSKGSCEKNIEYTLQRTVGKSMPKGIVGVKIKVSKYNTESNVASCTIHGTKKFNPVSLSGSSMAVA